MGRENGESDSPGVPARSTGVVFLNYSLDPRSGELLATAFIRIKAASPAGTYPCHISLE